MDNIVQQLNRLIHLTGQLLHELEEEELSPESIRQMMDKRERCVQKLGQISKSVHRKFLSSTDQETLTSLFDEFIHLDEKLRKSLRKTLHQQQSKLTDTSRKKQAVKSYRKASEKPDISFF